MRRRSALRAAVTVAIVVAVALPGTAGASTGPTPGSPDYLARDAQNIADAYGRQTAPDSQLSPAYAAADAAYIGPVFAAGLLAQAATPNRPFLREKAPTKAAGHRGRSSRQATRHAAGAPQAMASALTRTVGSRVPRKAVASERLMAATLSATGCCVTAACSDLTLNI